MAFDPNEFKQFMTQASMKLTGASDAGIRAELFDVLKEFFADSNSWTEDIEFQPTANVDEYVLTPLDDGQIIRLVGTFDDKGLVIPAFMRDFGTLKLVHAPASTPAVRWFSRVVKNIVLPTTSNGTPIGPEWLLRVYSVHILDGLLGKMMAHVNKSYSNSAMSVYHLKRFRTGIQIAAGDAKAANLAGAQAWAFPRFGGGSQRGGVSTSWPTSQVF